MSPPGSSGKVTEVRHTHSASLPEVLERAKCSLLISTYQAGQLVSVGTHQDQVVFSFCGLDQAMGVAVGEGQVAVGGKGQVWFLTDHPEFAGNITPTGRYDRCLLTRRAVVTGGIQCHEVVWGIDDSGQPDLWLVNTLFSCLAGLDPAYSFVPRWRPPFITQLAAQDRCHLNGLAMRDGKPAHVTVMARSDEPGGWRTQRNDSGAILDVPSGEPVATGLSMPHSPRWYEDQLYVLNSGFGRLERVDAATGQRDIVALLPGYARGLAIHNGLAFIGLSRIRETAIFGGAPIAQYHEKLKCGVGIVDLATGDTVATIEFLSGVEEIFDVQVVPGARCPALAGTANTDGEIWIVPERLHH